MNFSIFTFYSEIAGLTICFVGCVREVMNWYMLNLSKIFGLDTLCNFTLSSWGSSLLHLSQRFFVHSTAHRPILSFRHITVASITFLATGKEKPNQEGCIQNLRKTIPRLVSGLSLRVILNPKQSFWIHQWTPRARSMRRTSVSKFRSLKTFPTSCFLTACKTNRELEPIFVRQKPPRAHIPTINRLWHWFTAFHPHKSCYVEYQQLQCHTLFRF